MRKSVYLLLMLVFPLLSSAQIDNAGMEFWRQSMAGDSTPVAIQEPVSWFGSDSVIIALGQTIGAIALNSHDTDWRRQIFEESVIVHSGLHAAKIVTTKEDSFYVPGVLSNANVSFTLSYSAPGVTGVQLSSGSPVTAKPTTVSAWIKYFPGTNPGGGTGIDSGAITVQSVSFIGGVDSVVGSAFVTIPPSSSWLQVTANIVYTDTLHPVDTVRIAFSSGYSANSLNNSTLYVDDVSMTTVPNPIDYAGVQNVTTNRQIKVYPNPSSGLLYIDGVLSAETLKLYALNGELVATQSLQHGHNTVDVSPLPEGMYFYDVHDVSGNIVQRGKIVLSK